MAKRILLSIVLLVMLGLARRADAQTCWKEGPPSYNCRSNCPIANWYCDMSGCVKCEPVADPDPSYVRRDMRDLVGLTQAKRDLVMKRYRSEVQSLLSNMIIAAPEE